MTCIAWDGKTLAADKLAINGNTKRTVTKIFKIKNKLIGIAGTYDQGILMLDWVRRGMKPEDFPKSQENKDDWTPILVIDKSSVKLIERTPYPWTIEDKFTAIGCARDFAISAMYLGKSAKEAVEIACLFDSGCGNGIDVLTL